MLELTTKKFYVVKNVSTGIIDVVGAERGPQSSLFSEFEVLATIENGDMVRILPPKRGKNAWNIRILVDPIDYTVTLNSINVLQYCSGIEFVTEEKAAYMALSSMGKTIDGYTVEPDGTSPDGWPSWPLMYGAI